MHHFTYMTITFDDKHLLNILCPRAILHKSLSKWLIENTLAMRLLQTIHLVLR